MWRRLTLSVRSGCCSPTRQSRLERPPRADEPPLRARHVPRAGKNSPCAEVVCSIECATERYIVWVVSAVAMACTHTVSRSGRGRGASKAGPCVPPWSQAPHFPAARATELVPRHGWRQAWVTVQYILVGGIYWPVLQTPLSWRMRRVACGSDTAPVTSPAARRRSRSGRGSASRAVQIALGPTVRRPPTLAAVQRA